MMEKLPEQQGPLRSSLSLSFRSLLLQAAHLLSNKLCLILQENMFCINSCALFCK